MPRPPLVLGTWGKINVVQRAPGVHVAYARYRDWDGETRQLERTARTKTLAEQTLLAALRDRVRLDSDEVTADSAVAAVAEKWFADFIEGRKARNTEIAYRRAIDIITPGIGGLRLREISVSRLDRFLKAVTTSHGHGSAKTVKSVLSGVLSMAARHGAVDRNPLRDVAPISAPQIDEAFVLELKQLAQLRRDLYADELASLQDLAEPIDFMLATGVRIGEALALRWSELDLDGSRPTASIIATVAAGDVQPHPKSPRSRRSLTLPSWIADVLRARQERMPANELGLVFASVRGTVRDPSNLRRQWRAFRERHGWDDVVPKTFRKSIATLTGDPEIAAGQLGHADSRTTKVHYIKPTHEGPDLRELLDQIVAEPALTQRVERAKPRNSGNNRRAPKRGIA